MGAMNDFLTMVHENFALSSGREQINNSQPNCQHHQKQRLQQAQQTRRRPRLLNCEKAKLLNDFGVRSGGSGRTEDGHCEDSNESNWDLIPAPPITPPAEFRPNPESCYRRIAGLKRGKVKRGMTE